MRLHTSLRYGSSGQRDVAFQLLSNRTTFQVLARCISSSTGLADVTDPPIICDKRSACESTYPVFAYIAQMENEWYSAEASICAISSIANTPRPSVSEVTPDINEDVLARAVALLKSYGSRRSWYRLDFCSNSAANAAAFFGAKNNSQSINLMCNSGAAGISGVVLVYKNEISAFMGSTSGTCSPYQPSLLGYTVEPKKAEDTTFDFIHELYFIIPVSAGGGLLLIVVAATCFYSMSQPSTSETRRVVKHHTTAHPERNDGTGGQRHAMATLTNFVRLQRTNVGQGGGSLMRKPIHSV